MKRQQRISNISELKAKRIRGKGVVNTLIDKLPFELHLPSGLNSKYNFCGPATKLSERLARGDQGINPLDEACKEHDIAYSQSKDLTNRHKADEILENRAWERVKSKDASLGEKTAAWFVTNAMKAKRKLGMGMQKPKPGKPNPRLKIPQNMRKKGGALKRKTVKRKQRILPTPKKGGILPLLFPLLGALGALGGGAAGIAKAVNDAKANRQQLEEQKRHDLAMEAATKGNGLYLKPYKGYGIFLAYPRKRQ